MRGGLSRSAKKQASSRINIAKATAARIKKQAALKNVNIKKS